MAARKNADGVRIGRHFGRSVGAIKRVVQGCGARAEAIVPAFPRHPDHGAGRGHRAGPMVLPVQ